jgi:hypothetical protein
LPTGPSPQASEGGRRTLAGPESVRACVLHDGHRAPLDPPRPRATSAGRSLSDASETLTPARLRAAGTRERSPLPGLRKAMPGSPLEDCRASGRVADLPRRSGALVAGRSAVSWLPEESLQPHAGRRPCLLCYVHEVGSSRRHVECCQLPVASDSLTPWDVGCASVASSARRRGLRTEVRSPAPASRWEGVCRQAPVGSPRRSLSRHPMSRWWCPPVFALVLSRGSRL